MLSQRKRPILEEWDAFIEKIEKTRSIEKVIGALDDRMKHLGFERSAYWLRWPNDPKKHPIILSTYPKNFVDRYVKKDYGAHDMVGKMSTNTNRPFGWRELETKYKITRQQRIIFHDSSSVGLKEGASVPIHGPNLTKATFSVTSNLRKKEFDELFKYHQHEIHILATSAHERLMALGLGRTEDIQELTSRETQIILWVARGLTYEEIADKLCIQEDTIKKHMQNIFRKLNASNRPHAASVAIVHGLITP
ncbi:MAG TPA: LuxR family transcriptional regulator [Gammaproteobacteria bacterium]|jgi:DNA-binding CsgD family transcriptional regulator|nr:LuxR family transcriptional regulator [Gammaproteobacteria bacterium]